MTDGVIELDMTLIRTDPGTQSRATMDMDTVAEYTDAITNHDSSSREWPFPPVVVYFDGAAYWLADGFHRIAAAKRVTYPNPIPADVREGSRREAILFAAGANADHGLKRSPADKRSAVKILLRDAEWGRWSDRTIAEKCKVSHTFVANIRRTLTGGETAVTGNVASENGAQRPEERTYTTKQGTQTTIVYHPVRSLQVAIDGWLRFQAANTADRLALINSLKVTGANGPRWREMLEALPTPHRLNDVRQAVNNAADIWQQQWERENEGDLRKRLRECLESDRLSQFREIGLTDEQLREYISRQWNTLSGSGGPNSTNVCCKGGADPAFYYNASSPYGIKPTLRGAGLLRMAREVLEIPYPANERGVMTVPNRQVYAAVKQLRDRGHEIVHHGDINKWAVNGTRMDNDEVWAFLDNVMDEEGRDTAVVLNSEHADDTAVLAGTNYNYADELQEYVQGVEHRVQTAVSPPAAPTNSDSLLLAAVTPAYLALLAMEGGQRRRAAMYLKNMASDEPKEIGDLFRALSLFVNTFER